MEYLEGESLSSMLKRTGPLDLAAACGIMEPTLLALAAAHAKGIVHRDLKPENIFLVAHEGETPAVKLIDFGISKFTGVTGQSKLTQTGSLLGTPSYMSPEQTRGSGEVDLRTDIYSMGVILYEMLTGKLPFTGENYNELLINILTTDPLPPSEAHAEFPADAEEVVMKAISRNPEDRYQSSEEMIEALKATSSFGHRHERLTHLASGIARTAIAGGDLGDEDVTPDSQVASDMLMKMAQEATPNAWAGTGGTQAKSKSRVIMGAVLLIAVIVAVGAGMYLYGREQQGSRNLAAPLKQVPLSTEVVPEKKPEPEKIDDVKIEVKGTPEGAKIYYRDAIVPVNPFWVKKGKSLVQLRVEAEGFETFKYSVQPSENRVVEVVLKPVEKKKTDSTRKKKSSKSRRKPRTTKKIVEVAPAPEKKVEPPEKKLKESGRGTRFSTDFE